MFGGTASTAVAVSLLTINVCSRYYTVMAIDNASNASAATSALNITTDRELLVQDNFNRQDGALTTPWTANLGAATYYVANGGYCPPESPTSCFDLTFETAPINGALILNSLRLNSAASYGLLPAYEDLGSTEWGNLWNVGSWHPFIWSQAALTPGTSSFKATVDVGTNTSAGGVLFYAQSTTGAGVNHGAGTPTYASTRGFRALLQSGSVVLQDCSDLNYLDNPSNVCTTVGSATGVPVTGTISVETNASTGSVQVYVNGALKITATVSTGLMSGPVGAASLGYYDYDMYGNPTTYHTATIDNFLLEGN